MPGKDAGVLLVLVLAFSLCAFGDDSNKPSDGVVLTHYKDEYSSSARVEPARMDGRAGVAVSFEGDEELHYYARPEKATASGFELIVGANSPAFVFGEAVYPKWKIITDPLGRKVEVYAGDFAVFVPIEGVGEGVTKADVEVTISGQACTSAVCIEPFKTTIPAKVDYGQVESWQQISFEKAPRDVQSGGAGGYSVWFALVLAFAAGVLLNIMPCVWPVLPLVIMRIVEQAGESRRRSFSMGLAFCAGILLFFACLAGANIVLKSFYDTSLGWGDHMRNPLVVTFLVLLMVVMSLFMFGVFTVSVPSSVAGRSGSGKGYAGSVGMGFLAAVLSTPCSFAVLTTAFVWAQGQALMLGTFAIMVIGLGMAVPYAILTAMPGFLGRLPRAGRWMELVKQGLGFVLLVIAVKLIKGLPDAGRINVLFFAVVLSFCVWMWGGWVSFGTKLSRKILVRVIAVAICVLAWMVIFTTERVEWTPYDAARIEQARLEGRPVLIDFTAGWCANCEIVDKVVYQRRDISGLIAKKDVLAIRADTSEESMPATAVLKNVYKEAVPVTILYLPGRDEPVRFSGEIFFAKKLKQALQSLASKRDDDGEKENGK